MIPISPTRCRRRQQRRFAQPSPLRTKRTCPTRSNSSLRRTPVNTCSLAKRIPFASTGLLRTLSSIMAHGGVEIPQPVSNRLRMVKALTVPGNGITGTTTLEERDTDAPEGAKLFQEREESGSARKQRTPHDQGHVSARGSSSALLMSLAAHFRYLAPVRQRDRPEAGDVLAGDLPSLAAGFDGAVASGGRGRAEETGLFWPRNGTRLFLA
jgi:hypothetical protein